MDSFQLSDKGISRELNEDCFGSFLSKDGRVRFFIVADGMGGHLAGEVASNMAVTLFGEAAASYKYKDEESLRKFLRLSVINIDREIYNKAKSSENCSNMGTTAVIYAVADDYGLFCNVGDSRGYTVSGGVLTQITKDHSLVQSMLDSGYIFDSENQQSPFKNAITKALGFLSQIDGEKVYCDIYKVTPGEGDVILLCSDGLSSMVSGDEILSVIEGGGELSSVAEQLISAANERGGHDNITVSLIRYRDGRAE